MSDPFIGEIQIFGFNYVPQNWMACNGATLQTSQYPALFALIGTTYGGNGSSTFMLPNLVSRAACGQGTGNNLTPRTIGKTFGQEAVVLTPEQMPSHTHSMNIFAVVDNPQAIPVNNGCISTPSNAVTFASVATSGVTFAGKTIGSAGTSLAHENRQPLLALNFCIAIDGEYPSFD
ncbi:phage tail protein [Glaciimonas sp. GG7]